MELLKQQIQGLFNSRLVQLDVPMLPLKLWLLDPNTHLDARASQSIEAIWSNMPYWAFVWSSGHGLAQHILSNPVLVKGKVVADFGAGSGVVALAALKAGAAKAIVVDNDPHALIACRHNAELNQLEVATAKSLEQAGNVDLLLVGDVLYDPQNHILAQTLFAQETPFIWAESQAQTKLADYQPVNRIQGDTLPNLGNFDEHRFIHIYQHGEIETG